MSASEMQAGGMYASGDWAAANRVAAVLRAALYGAPAGATLSAGDTARQELIAAASLGVATDMAMVAMIEWSRLTHHAEGVMELTPMCRADCKACTTTSSTTEVHPTDAWKWIAM
jgi:hypothetical protein